MVGYGRWGRRRGNARRMFKLFYYVWRLIATGIAFFIFGVGGVFLTLSVFPVIALAISDEQKRREKVQGLIHSSFRLFVRGLLAFGLIDLNISGRERLLSVRECYWNGGRV